MKNTVFLISDNAEVVAKAKALYESDSHFVLKVFTPSQWEQIVDNPSMRNHLHLGVPMLSAGLTQDGGGGGGGKILTFKQGGDLSNVETMDQVEARAIESAISQFKGNLTEAAKALGIGRATLYRKVKYFQIDPSAARKKRVA
jgi:transcriptional regulator of acetoin/glycerol metabolism